MFGPKKRVELARLRARLRPEAITLEAERSEQPRLDGFYERYRAGQLALPAGRSER